MQQPETFLSQKVNFFPIEFYYLLERGITTFSCNARGAHSPGAFIVTELLERGVTLLPTLSVGQNLSSEAGAFKLSDLPNIT